MDNDTCDSKSVFRNSTVSLLDRRFTSYGVNDIPLQDLYRLIFNRITELLEAIVLNKNSENEIKGNSLDLISTALAKLHFALIQSILISNGILIFGRSEIDEIRKCNLYELSHPELILGLLESYEEIVNSRTSQEGAYMIPITSWWDRAIQQVSLTLTSLGRMDNLSESLDARSLFEDEGLRRKLMLCVIIILEYIGICPIRNLLTSLIFIGRFGSDYVYYELYGLFLSGNSLFGSGNISVSKKIWLRSFKKYLQVWKLRSGV